MSDLSAEQRVPCRVRGRTLLGLPPLAHLLAGSIDAGSMGWHLLYSRPWAETGATG